MNLFSLAVFLFILAPRLLTFGMFLDGSVYSSIARNMAEGYGSFWAPYYIGPINSVAWWHPPLAYKLHSFFYAVIGDYHFVDTFYGLTGGLISLFLIQKIHKVLNAERSAWFSMILFSVMPMVSWTFSNNMLEITMTVFILLSTYVQIILIKQSGFKAYAGFFISGGLLSLAVLSKNIAGVFPLILPVLFMVFREKTINPKLVAFSVLHTLGMAFFLWAIIYFTGGMDFYKEYLNQQLVPSLAGTAPGENSSMIQKVARFGSELIIPSLICLAAVYSQKRKFSIKLSPEAIVMIITGLSGILPLFLIAKFRAYYVFPGLPFLTIGLGLLFSETAEEIGGKMKTYFKKIIFVLIGLFIVSGIAMMIAGNEKNARNSAWKRDIYNNTPAIPERSELYFCNQKLERNFTIVAYMQRYFKWSPGDKNSKYLFVDSKHSCNIPAKCKALTPAENKRYHIYQCQGE